MPMRTTDWVLPATGATILGLMILGFNLGTAPKQGAVATAPQLVFPPKQTDVCNLENESFAASLAFNEAWKAEPNGIVKAEIRNRRAAAIIKRNVDIYTPMHHMDDWVVRLKKDVHLQSSLITSTDPSDIVELRLDVPCSPNLSIDAEVAWTHAPDKELLSTLRAGDIVKLSGSLVHYRGGAAAPVTGPNNISTYPETENLTFSVTIERVKAY